MPQLEIDLEYITNLENCNDADKLQREVTKFLKHNSSFVVAKTAQLAITKRIQNVGDHLISAYNRFKINPIKRDPGCKAKLAIVQALTEFHAISETIFIHATYCTQMEPVWGGRVDTAGTLRCAGAAGLMSINYPDVINELARLLCDPERETRAGAAKLIASTGEPTAEPLLRMRILSEESDEEVLPEIFSSIIIISTTTGLEFVSSYLNDQNNPNRANAAALALGQSKNPKAFDYLLTQFERELDHEYRETLLYAMSMLRIDKANNFLADLIRDENTTTATQAIKALSIFYYDPSIKDLVINAAANRDDLQDVLKEDFL
ncbi:HEAT repeat domain-containing protein [Planctomycetota bacterium]|nr:HEAT repeat domain-containing protein [Planctomycetota bacterium]